MVTLKNSPSSQILLLEQEEEKKRRRLLKPKTWKTVICKYCGAKYQTIKVSDKFRCDNCRKQYEYDMRQKRLNNRKVTYY